MESPREILFSDASEITFKWLLEWIEDDVLVELKRNTLVEFVRSLGPNAPFFIESRNGDRRSMCDVIANAFVVWMEEAGDESYESDDDDELFEETVPYAPSKEPQVSKRTGRESANKQLRL